MLYSWATFDGLPPRETLHVATGQVDWVRSDKYGIEFALQGSDRAYQYLSKGNAKDVVESRLRKTRAPVTILFDPTKDSAGLLFSEGKFYDVFELSTPAGPFRRYEDVEAAWRSDEALALWMSPMFLGMAIYLLVLARARRP